jgi:hypothetical protein
MSQEQIVNQPTLYVNGLNLAWASNTTLTVATGQCRDSTNVLDMSLSNAATINAAVNGVNGLDTGTLAASTLYWVFLIADLQGFKPTAALLSLSPTAPTLPYGYGAIRRIGRCLTDGSVHILPFTITGTGGGKYVQFNTPISVLSGGTSSTFAAVNLLIGAPSVTNPTLVYLNYLYTPTTAASLASLRATGATTTSGNCPVELKGNVSAVSFKSHCVILPAVSSGNLSIDYVVTASDALTLTLAAFQETL